MWQLQTEQCGSTGIVHSERASDDNDTIWEFRMQQKDFAAIYLIMTLFGYSERILTAYTGGTRAVYTDNQKKINPKQSR